MNVMLTGATGFIGRHLLPELLAAGHNAVALTRTDVKERCANALYINVSKETDYENLCKSYDIEVIIHLATFFCSSHTRENLDSLLESNMGFGARLLDGAARAKVRWFVNTATAWQHYENASYSPVNLYAATKQAFADILKFYGESGAIKTATLGLQDTYGPSDTRGKLLNLWKRMIQSGEALNMSPGEQLIDLIYISDVCSGFMHLLNMIEMDKGGLAGQEFFLSGGCPMPLRDLAVLFENISERKLNITWGGSPYRPREMMAPYPGAALPGWSPKVDIKDGLRMFLGKMQ